jgi:hypothetical protein
MRPRGAVSSFSRPFFVFAILMVSVPVFAEDIGQSRVICRETLASGRRQELSNRLRTITGWTDLRFSEDGSLQLGKDAPNQGSAAARTLLTSAVSGPAVLIVEDASNHQDVVFGKLVPGKWQNNSTQNPPAYVIRIDFADFDQLIGDRSALEAFDAAWTLLHEIDHAVHDSADAAELGQPGQCEEHINQMRRELNLPERSDYFFTSFPATELTGFPTRFVRLRFDRKEGSGRSRRPYWIMWNAVATGGWIDSKQVAALRPR